MNSALGRWWRAAWAHPGLQAAVRLFVVGLLLGWLYGWANPRLHPADTRCGFAWGLAHGACMPMALPALLMGKDVDIYAARNTGRAYKIGYIAGINLCGLVFFGGAFWKPRPHSRHPATPTNPADLDPESPRRSPLRTSVPQ